MGDSQTITSEAYYQQLTRLKAVDGRKNGLLRSMEKEQFYSMTMPDPTLQKQPNISLKNLAGKSCITHHILPIFSCTNRFSTSFRSLQNHLMGQRLPSREEVEMKLSKLANFYEEGMRKLMARWKDVINKNGDYAEH
ncbi:hypothetical protein ACTXT7_002318 [Hymenolepis weldensis]